MSNNSNKGRLIIFSAPSGAGKSSLINSICRKRNIAKVSGKPGKTKLINHFKINDSWYLTDLPGYGYANVSKTVKKNIDKLISCLLYTSPSPRD